MVIREEKYTKVCKFIWIFLHQILSWIGKFKRFSGSGVQAKVFSSMNPIIHDHSLIMIISLLFNESSFKCSKYDSHPFCWEIMTLFCQYAGLAKPHGHCNICSNPYRIQDDCPFTDTYRKPCRAQLGHLVL